MSIVEDNVEEGGEARKEALVCFIYVRIRDYEEIRYSL